MSLFRKYARLAALATAVALTVNCDSRTPTQPCLGANCGVDPTAPPVGSDNTAPTVSVKLATGTTSADTIVYIGGNLGIVISAADEKGVSTLSTTMRGPLGSSVVDSVTYSPTLTTVSRTYTIDVATVAKGDRLVFTTRAADASFNPRLDSLKVVVSDTATPVVTVASKINGTVKGRDSVDVAVVATDAAGIDSAGVRLVHVRGVGDTVLVFARSSKPSVRTTTHVVDFGFRISDTLPVGQYLLIPFGADRSGLASRNAVPFSFQLADATRPTILLLNPTVAGHIAQGDTVRVRAELRDNAGLGSVTFEAFTTAGDSALGTYREIPRYATVRAPASGSLGVRIDTVTRDMIPVGSGEPFTDSLTIRAVVTDLSNNSTTITLKVALVPTLSVSSPSVGTVLRNGDSLRVRVTAGDTTGVLAYGYSLQRTGDAQFAHRDSVLPPAGTFSATNEFRFVMPDSLLPGTYTLRAFSRVASVIGGRTATAGTLTLQDGRPPTVILSIPVTGSRQAVGDSLYVVANLADNIGVDAVTFRAVSFRGDSAIGTLVQIDRYAPVRAPATGTFPAGTKAINVQRYLRAITPVDSTADSLIVTATVTDNSGQTATARAKVQMVPTLSISSPSFGRTLRNGDVLTATVNAGDTLGVTYFGYSLQRVGDTAAIRRDSVLPPAGTYAVSQTFTFTLPDSIQPGAYTLSAFSRVQSPIGTRTAAGGSLSIADGVAPMAVMNRPINGGSQAVGDSLFVDLDLSDNVGVSRVNLRAFSVRGDSALGTRVEVARYTPLVVPPAGSFPAGTRATKVQRYMQVVTAPKVDSTADSLVVEAVVTDVSGLSRTVRNTVAMTNGPRVAVIQPVLGDSITKGTSLTITVTGLSNVGVRTLGFVLSDSGFVTPITPASYDTLLLVPSLPNKTVSFSRTIPIPASAAGYLVITPFGTDVNGQPSSGVPFRIGVRSSAAPAPVVRQTLAARVEIVDSVLVSVSGTSLRTVGYVLRETVTRALVDSGTVPASASSFGPANIGFQIAPQFQGKRVELLTFATDSLGKTGYSVPANVTLPVTDPARARRDTALVVYGRTFALPAARPGTIADVIVDTNSVGGRNVFLSNIEAGRLEVFKENTTSFDAQGIVVGSQPWGMTLSRTAPLRDTLYVANSGGTNLSRVYIGSAGPMKEDLTNRIKTRMSFLYKITEIRDEATGKIRISLSNPISFSDRPQFVQQSSGGRLYISTKPTAAAPRGTVRFIDPTAAAPDERFLLAFAAAGTDLNAYLVANVDGASVAPASAASSASDTLILCDHASGTTAPPTCARSADGIGATLAALRAAVPTTDIEAVAGADESSLALTDTTFVASSGNGDWIGFGEGQAALGRVMLIKDADPTATRYSYATPSISIRDLVNNASDALFGMALDKTGQTLGVHGVESYFALVDEPFTQRLQGKRTTFAQGSGIAFHPGADGITTPERERLAFVASANGTVEIIDIAHYDFNRGTLVTKTNFYGPIRAVNPTAAEIAAGIRVKLYGMSANGLVIIDVTDSDIIAGP